jgi:hypothetical protein
MEIVLSVLYVILIMHANLAFTQKYQKELLKINIKSLGFSITASLKISFATSKFPYSSEI